MNAAHAALPEHRENLEIGERISRRRGVPLSAMRGSGPTLAALGASGWLRANVCGVMVASSARSKEGRTPRVARCSSISAEADPTRLRRPGSPGTPSEIALTSSER
jgi:hypothetical protein